MYDSIYAIVVSDISGFNLDTALSYVRAPLMLLVGVMIAYLLIFLTVKAFITVSN